MTVYKLFTSIYTTQIKDTITEYNENKPSDDVELELPESYNETIEFFSVERSSDDLETAAANLQKVIKDWNVIYV